MRLLSRLLAFGLVATLCNMTLAQTDDGSRPDPRQIPVPPIVTSLGKLPGPDDLPARPEMPDVLTMNDGTRVTKKEQWAARREEMRRTLEYYAIGQAPPAPGNVRGTVVKTQMILDGKAKYRLVHLTFGPNESLSLDIGIFTPVVGGPFPAVISPSGTPPGAIPLKRLPQGPTQGKGQDVLLLVGPGTQPSTASARPTSHDANDPETIAARNPGIARGYAFVTFNHNDCGEDTTLREADGTFSFRTTRFYPAYPNYDWGLLRGWAWGVSRIVDYLETDPEIDKTKLIVTGVSRTGKSAMVAGAFDDRIAITAPCVSGGGGVGAYRFSGDGRGGKEGLTIMIRKYPNWFAPNLHQFWGRPDKLPFDNHWFLALIAPRGFISLEGTDDGVSLENAVKQSYLHARPAFELLGVPERIGVNYANHGHTINNDDWDAMLTFADNTLFKKPVDRRFDLFPSKSTTQPK